MRIGSFLYVFRKDEWGSVFVYYIQNGRERLLLNRAAFEDALADLLEYVFGEEVKVVFKAPPVP